jgi:hypothetical protein
MGYETYRLNKKTTAELSSPLLKFKNNTVDTETYAKTIGVPTTQAIDLAAEMDPEPSSKCS